MSVYARFKRSQDGFRSLVELLESTPQSRRKKMIDVGMAEDPAYTEKALQYVLSFEDVMQLPDMELAELIAASPPRMTGFSMARASEETQLRFLKNAKPQIAAQVKEYMGMTIGLAEIGGAQLKLIEITRRLEKKGLIQAKKIPVGA